MSKPIKKEGKLNIRKTKRWIIFTNGIKVFLPKGYHFGEKFEIRGIEQDKPNA